MACCSPFFPVCDASLERNEPPDGAVIEEGCELDGVSIIVASSVELRRKEETSKELHGGKRFSHLTVHPVRFRYPWTVQSRSISLWYHQCLDFLALVQISQQLNTFNTYCQLIVQVREGKFTGLRCPHLEQDLGPRLAAARVEKAIHQGTMLRRAAQGRGARRLLLPVANNLS